MPNDSATSRSAIRILDSAIPPAVLIILLAVVVVLTRGASRIIQREVTSMLILVVVVVGLYVFMGTSGILSFGHISFMALAAYAAAFATIPAAIKGASYRRLPEVLQNFEAPWFVGVMIGALAATFIALIIAYPINRLPPVSLGLAMFALLLATHTFVQQIVAWMTGGQTSVFAIPQRTTQGWALLFASIVIVVAHGFQRSRVGIRLIASREDEFGAIASGINVRLHRGIAFLLSAFMVGLGGALFVTFLGTLAPDTFFFTTTLITLAMLVVGGVGSLTGAVVGTLVVSFFSTVLRELEDGFDVGPWAVPSRPGLTALGLGSILIVMLIFRPGGLTASREVPGPSEIRRRIRRRRKDRAKQDVNGEERLSEGHGEDVRNS